MRRRLFTILLMLVAAVCATAPATVGAQEPEEPEPIPQFWTEEDYADEGGSKPSAGGTEPTPPTSAPQPSPSDQTSTSPGGTAPGSGTATTGPGAEAPTDPPSGSGEVVLECDPSAGLRRALRSLHRAIRGRQLLTLRPQPFAVRVKPCVAGTFELSIVEDRTGVVLWRARRDLKTTRRATLRMTMTRAGRRFVANGRPGQRVRMKLRAKLTP